MLNIRFASADSQNSPDIGIILSFIKGLAVYEKLEDQVVATEAKLFQSLFVEKAAEVLIAEWDGKPAGFALFFHNYSTFLAQKGIYLEDLYVDPNLRGQGLGKALLKRLAEIALERQCGRLEWSVLDWNKPAIDFYVSIGAKPNDEWTIYRMVKESMLNFVGKP